MITEFKEVDEMNCTPISCRQKKTIIRQESDIEREKKTTQQLPSTMELRCVSFMVSFGLFLIIAGHADCSCPSLQYIVIGTTGVIQCSFEEGFFGVLWYNSTETLHQEAILISRKSEKSGIGYNAGEYDVYPNGSLVIYNVSKHHESNYTVILLQTTTDLSVDFIINVLVNAETFIPYTRIHQCSDIMKVCLQQWDKNSDIVCYVQDARLMIPLKWIVKTISGDRNISSHLSVTNQTSYFTSEVTTTNPFLFSSFLTLLVCKADDPMGLLTRTQSTVLISNDKLYPKSENVITKYLQTGSKMRLDCSYNEFSFLLWHLKKTLEDKPTPVVYAVLTEDVFSHRYDDDYALQNDSSLVVHSVRMKHEGFYSCISGDGMTDDIIVYNVIAFGM
ncbi:hypothetical protein HOLleu_03596 [Holothuria leucospilota]|uniref:Immunoglobulin domain-containing protein n=1 Tax=Holothuria leucospilota TaxID=206669 RepID=A0A9Q1HLF2_HOLLE|nr:hypothetical protein HOLleu_03596 [Holothuria leucospilota]